MKPDTIDVTDEQIPVRVSGAVQAEVDGELILLSPKDFTYFGAEGAGGPVWELIDGKRSAGAIVAELEGSFDADPGVIRADTFAYLETLTVAGLIELTPTP